MSGGHPHDDEDLDSGGDELAHEGVQAFNAMTAAIHGLQSRLGALDTGLGEKVRTAERAATKAETAAENAKQTAEHAAATARAGARAAAAWAVLGALAAVLVAGGAGYWLGHASGRESGLADGYRAALDQNAAASWANTPSGRMALTMDQLGSLAMVTGCIGQGWTAETIKSRRYCIVRPSKPDGTRPAPVLAAAATSAPAATPARARRPGPMTPLPRADG